MRSKSHFQEKEPILESILREIRFLVVRPYVDNNFRVLDLGCGYDGKFLRGIASKIKDGIGCDISVQKISSPKNISLYSKRINKKLILPNNHFDLVTSLAVFEHLGKADDVIKKAYKALKKDGRLVITTPSPSGKKLLDSLAFFNLISQTEINDHKHYYSKTEILKIFSNAGFNIKKIQVKYFAFGMNTLVVARK